MLFRYLAGLVAVLALSACGGGSDSPRADSAPEPDAAATSGECRILTAADVKAVTGADVRPIARGSVPGTGGTCGNYVTADGQAYLGVNALSSAGAFTASVNAVPADVYPQKTAMTGLGDEAVLFKDEGGSIKYLVARKGTGGVVIFPLAGGVSDEQLRQLAERALAAL